jgi:hypothetical protein
MESYAKKRYTSDTGLGSALSAFVGVFALPELILLAYLATLWLLVQSAAPSAGRAASAHVVAVSMAALAAVVPRAL